MANDGQLKVVSKEALRAVFTTLKDHIRLVVLNACYSHIQAEAIAEVIDAVIGMNAPIGDEAARIFAASFYRAIGFGRSLQDAFDQGKAALLLEDISEEQTLELLVKPGVDPSRLFLLLSSEQLGIQQRMISPSTIPDVSPMNYATCVLSYASEDQSFAEQLYVDLQKNGVRCWFAPEDMQIGGKKRDQVDEAIHHHEKLLLVLSEHSVQSAWVEKEVETAFDEEQLGKRLILFPIRIDDEVMNTRQPWAADIRRMRYIGDFKKWTQQEGYQKALARLLRDLKS